LALKETLKILHDQENREQQARDDRPKLIQEWKFAIDSLFGEVRTYLKEYETDGSLVFADDTLTITEDRLGNYLVPIMKIIAGPATIIFQPVARMIIGAFGRVDMHREGRANERYRVMFLRMPKSANDLTLSWHLRMPAEASSPLDRLPPQERIVSLTKNTLEQAIDFLLR
jgi:hypothetical protein